MKKVGVLLFVLFLIPFAFADDTWFLKSNQSLITTNISFTLGLQKQAYQFRIPSLSFNTTLFPKNNFRQRVISNLINLDKNITGKNFYYEWQLPRKNKTVNINSYLEINDIRSQIRNKIKFPVQIREVNKKYLEPTKLIDSHNPKIRDLATSLAEKDDDLFDVVFKIGVWVNQNVKYFVSDETVNNTKSASWVLDNRKGVCDEMAGLFIAMCRSLNIPARYVGGMAYSNTNGEKWLNHAWAEVNFPSIGWVPFDTVYGEFGYVDVSHIQFYTSPKVSPKTTEVSYKSTEAKVILLGPKINVKLMKNNGKESKKTEMTLTPFKDTVGFSSFNYLDLKVHNLKNYYVSEKLFFDKTAGIKFSSPMKTFVLLAPNETKHLYFIFQNNLTFTDRYVYKQPITVHTSNGYEASTIVQTKPNYQILSFKTISDYVNLKNQEVKSNSGNIVKDIELKCTPKSDFTYSGYTFTLPCYVKNIGNTKLDYFQLCSGSNCRAFNLAIGEEKQINFNTSFDNSGAKSLITKLTGKNITKSYFNSIMVYPKPLLKITNLNYTKNVTYKDKFHLQFEIVNQNETPIQNLMVKIKHPYLKNSWKIKNFKTRWIVKVNGRGKDLLIGKNNISIILEYQDLFGNNLNSTGNVEVYLKKLNIIQRIPLMVRDFLKWLDSLF